MKHLFLSISLLAILVSCSHQQIPKVNRVCNTDKEWMQAWDSAFRKADMSAGKASRFDVVDPKGRIWTGTVRIRVDFPDVIISFKGHVDTTPHSFEEVLKDHLAIFDAYVGY